MYEELRAIVNCYDPVGIAEIDIDEYEPEIRAILGKTNSKMSQKELELLVQKVFEHYFYKNCAPISVYKNIARELYALLKGK